MCVGGGGGGGGGGHVFVCVCVCVLLAGGTLVLLLCPKPSW